MANDWPQNEVDVKFNSWRTAMAPTNQGEPPATPPLEDMRTWDTAQISTYYQMGGQEP